MATFFLRIITLNLSKSFKFYLLFCFAFLWAKGVASHFFVSPNLVRTFFSLPLFMLLRTGATIQVIVTLLTGKLILGTLVVGPSIRI